MAATTVTMPQLGESVVEGTIVKWLAQPGQRVELDQPLVEIATDKANTEIPSPSAGVLVEVIAQEGAVVQVGGALARLDDASQAAAAQPPAAAKPAPQPAPPPAQAAPPPPPRTFPGTPRTGGPATIPPPVSSAPYATGPVPLQLRAYKPPRYTPKEGDQVIPFDHRRRLVAEHMVYSKFTSPHVPCTAEVDMTPFARLREEWKKAKETGGKAPSFLVGLCRAAVQALAEFPRMNAVVQDESLIVRKDVNLGVAVDTDKGLLVPVIRRANEKSVLGLGRALDDLAARARTGKVTADELSGGSFTVSNPGLKGNLFGASIINQPQVGILRMGEIVKRAVVREIGGEDAIVIRQMMYLTLSYDHRVIDGVTGNGFLHRVRELIEAAKFAL